MSNSSFLDDVTNPSRAFQDKSQVFGEGLNVLLIEWAGECTIEYASCHISLCLQAQLDTTAMYYHHHHHQQQQPHRTYDESCIPCREALQTEHTSSQGHTLAQVADRQGQCHVHHTCHRAMASRHICCNDCLSGAHHIAHVSCCRADKSWTPSLQNSTVCCSPYNTCL